jgi:sec-independent protein translocase protein TatB
MGHPPTIQFASLGMADSLILMVLALVVFGPRRLPQIGRQIGKLMYEFRKASNDFKYQMEEELRNSEETDRRKTEEERLRALALAPPVPAVVDSQVSEVRLEAPIYPEEADYPAAVAPTVEAVAEETYPRIQPPSTGEQVPAARPWSLEAELAKVSGATDPVDDARTRSVSDGISAEGQAAETTPDAEQAPHG